MKPIRCEQRHEKCKYTTHKNKTRRVFKKRWENKVMHGQYIRSTDRQLISEEDTFLCLLWEDRKGKTESEIIAAQDQALQAKYRETNLLPTEIDSKWRHSKQFDETMEHIISACPILAKEQYTKETC
jgi:hypothetical protein